MPHYADGTEAKVGDAVTGTFFNTPGVRAGTIISITPGQEACNAQIQFAVAVEDDSHPDPPRMKVGEPRQVRGQQHGSAGPLFNIWTCVDYCDTNKFTKVG